MVSTISIAKHHKQTLQNHAQKFEPNESCAVLYGKIQNTQTTVEDIFLAKNIDDSSKTFTISNEELIAAYKKAEDDNTKVVAIFHSHPESEASPSRTDVKFMEINPVIWVIYSGVNKDFRAFTLENKMQEIQITD